MADKAYAKLPQTDDDPMKTTTTTPRESPVIILFLLGKFCGTGLFPIGYSLINNPLAIIDYKGAKIAVINCHLSYLHTSNVANINNLIQYINTNIINITKNIKFNIKAEINNK